MTREENAWKAAVCASIGTMLLIGVGVAVANIALDAEEAQEQARRAPTVFEDCDPYAAQMRRDTPFGSNEENRKSDQAMAAYQQCLARRGY